MAIIRQEWIELKRAARRGDVEAQYRVGTCYYDGLWPDDLLEPEGGEVVRASARSAEFWYRKAADQGHKIAQNNLGNLLSGLGVRWDAAEAVRLYKNAGATSSVATVYRDQGDMRRAFWWWSKAAASGEEEALIDVGYCLYYGIGVRRNVENAFATLGQVRRSKFICESSREEALYHRAVAHLDQSGSDDRAKARALLKRANMDNDYPEARGLLAQLDLGKTPEPCRCRRGLCRNINGQANCRLHGRVRGRQKRLFCKHCNARQAGPQAIQKYKRSLGIVERDEVSPRDEAKAFRLNAESARRGCHEAVLAMGWHYWNGAGVEVDTVKARRWYLKSALWEEPKAMFSLGALDYEERDFAGALAWLDKAIDHGHMRSLFWLGKLHWRGQGVARDRKRAMRFFRLAAWAKVGEAERALRFLERRLKP